MSWIRTVQPENAQGRLSELYARIAGSGGQVDNILLGHSLRPHTLEGHLALYKAVLHHTGNRLPVALLELVGVEVSRLNACEYCVHHHYAGLERALGDPQRARAMWQALENGTHESAFDERERAVLRYAAALTRQPGALEEQHIDALRAAGLDDGEILEVNQVVSYFAYANRVVLGLGVTTEGDVLGTSPPDTADINDWRHTW